MSTPLLRTTPASIAHHVDALPPGTRLGEFEVVALLGVGGFGMVYQAFDHSLLRFVAIKEYMPTALAGRADGHSLWVRSSSDEQSFQAGLASFVEEARLLAQFDHPSLVKVFRFWEANQTAYMVMPLYSGMTLKQARAHMRTPPPEAWLRKVLWSITSALRVLHEGQTLHRDISPDNIFLQDHGPPVLLDLGAARHAISDKERRYTAVLKVNYAPIEQYSDAASNLRQGPWSDLYALGAVVHGCLCNDTPLPATLRAMRDRMVSFSRVARTVRKQFCIEYSRPFVEAISQALALQPEDRPQSIDAFLERMEMLAPPQGLEHFDFRADLGDIWVEPSSKDAQGVATPVIDFAAPSQPLVSQPLAEVLAQRAAMRTVQHAQRDEPPQDEKPSPAFQETVVQEHAAFADTSEVAWMPTQLPQERAARRHHKEHHHRTPHSHAKAQQAQPSFTRGRSLGLWSLMGIAALLVVGAGVWWGVGKPSTPRTPRYTPESEIITEWAEPASAPSAEVELLPVVHEEPLVLPETSEAPASVQAVVKTVQAQKGKGQRNASDPAPVAAAPIAEVRAAPVPVAPEPPPVRSTPVRQAGPDEVCASEGLFGRPMCIHRECQKPALAGHPVCADLRRKQEEEDRRRQEYAQ